MTIETKPSIVFVHGIWADGSQLYHRPLHMVLQFSAELENRLKGKVSPSLFATRDWDEFSRCSHQDSAWPPSR